MVGLGIFKPPNQHGKASNSRSSSEQGSLPVRAGLNVHVLCPPVVERGIQPDQRCALHSSICAKNHEQKQHRHCVDASQQY